MSVSLRLDPALSLPQPLHDRHGKKSFIKDPILGQSLQNGRTFTSVKVHPELAQQGGRWLQIAMIVSAIATAVFLSASGILPPAVLFAAKVGLYETVTTMALLILHGLVAKKSAKESEYKNTIDQMSPFAIAVAYPIVEEIIFRGIMQGGLTFILNRDMPVATISLLGLQLPLASALAMTIAGASFGYAHLFNKHENSHIQAINTGLSGIFVYGPMYHFYGLPATCFMHIINNTIFSVLIELVRSSKVQAHSAAPSAANAPRSLNCD